MYRDDYEERIRESNEYLDRRADQLDFERTLAERSDAIYTAIRKKDYSRASWELGIFPSGSLETDSSFSTASTESNRQPTAEEQFTEHSTRLIAILQYSSSLPTYVTQEWIRKVKKINLYQPSEALIILYNLFADYRRAVEEYKPRRDIFDLAVAETMKFDREMENIRRELDWLKAILKHVEDYLKKAGHD